MIDHQDYLAACDRLRRVASGEPWSAVYGNFSGESQCCLEDDDKLAVYDAEHDTRPATVEWLREIGFVPQAGNELLSIGCVHTVRRFSDRGLSLVVEDIDGEQVVVSKRPTRGDVLTMLRVFSERKV